jgi:hypothetical protein
MHLLNIYCPISNLANEYVMQFCNAYFFGKEVHENIQVWFDQLVVGIFRSNEITKFSLIKESHPTVYCLIG